MVFKNRYEFQAAPEEVFDAMTDPDVVASCLPGCDSLESVGENRYRATMTVGVAAIKGRFKGTIELQDLDRPASYTMRLNGRGPAGFARGRAEISISERAAASTVAVHAKAQIGGPVARVGQRLLAGTVKMVTDRFFACLRTRVELDAEAG